MKKKILTVTIIAALMISSISFGQGILPSAGTTPGSPFFAVERLFENVSSFFTFGKKAKAKRSLNLAEERLSEMKALSEKGKKPEKALKLYQKQYQKAKEKAQKAGVKALSQITEATSKHFKVLEEAGKKASKEAKQSIQNALEASKKGQLSALQALSKESPEEAAQAGVKAAQGIANQVKEQIKSKTKERIQEEFNHFGKLVSSTQKLTQKKVQAASRFSKEANQLIKEMGEMSEVAQKGKLDQKSLQKIKQVKDKVIEQQLSSLRGVAKDNPKKAVEIFSEAAKNQIEAIKEKGEKEAEMVQERIRDYEKYTQFGKEISELAKGIKTGTTSVEELVEKATSKHLKVLEEVKGKVPSQAQKGIHNAIQNAKRFQERIQEKIQKGIPQKGPGEKQGPSETPGKEETQQEEEKGPSETEGPQQKGNKSSETTSSQQSPSEETGPSEEKGAPGSNSPSNSGM